MKKIKHLLLVAMLFATATVLGQTKLSGTVVDETGEPLPGASVVVKGTTNGTATDFDGNFMLNSKSSSGEVVVSFVGYISKEVVFSSSKVKLGTIKLKEDGAILDEIVVTATSFAVDRKTPVAVSTIKAGDIERKLGNQEFPEILKSTPGVYATKSGGGFGDGKISMRGFKSENIAVMINGVPVNDMENGKVYWSNWAGLSDVTAAMQTQRGLGASKVAVPSIGGTINIVTKNTDAIKGGNIRIATGNDGYQKYGLTLSTGKLENGFAATTSVARISGDGFVNGTQFSGWNYFLNLSKEFNDAHILTLTTFGAPQRHGQRQNRSLISTYRNAEQGIRYNPDWGYKNGQVVHIEDNFYHKNQTSLNHYWTMSDDTSLSTALYFSRGTGGGGGTAGSNRDLFKARLGDFDQPVDLDNIVRTNRANASLGSEAFLRASRNDHIWYGLLSTFKTGLNDNLDVLAGVDLRQYTGLHFREVTDLLGGNFVLDNSDVNNPNSLLKVGDKFAYNNDGIVGWQGGFLQLEYGGDSFDAFVSGAISNTSYKRIDYFQYKENDSLRETSRYNFLGYSVKGGANYRFNDIHNVFANIGYFEKAPTFRTVFPRYNNVDINKNAENEKVFSMELGYGIRSEKFAANVNLYSTKWKDKSLSRRLKGADGQEFFANILGVNALHNGIELDFTWKPSDKLNVTWMTSIGDWRWNDDINNAPVFDENQNQVATIDLLIKDFKVADAAQTTTALGILYKFWEKTSITLDYNYFDRLYADFNILNAAVVTKKGKTSTATRPDQTWKAPSYNTLDASLRHGFDFGSFDTTLTLRVNNIFNTEYVSDALNGASSSATDALVWFGSGRTFSLGAKIKF